MRTIVRNHDFEARCTAIFTNPERGDTVLEGVEWALARDAERYPEVAGPYRSLKTDPGLDAPRCIITFKIEGDRVELVDIIEISEPDF